MPRLPKIIIITFTLYMLLCIPAFAAQTGGGFVSNTPMAAGPNASLGEVWMKHGGARLQYDALMGSVQMNTNGKMRRDPAAVTYLPPLYPQSSAGHKVNTRAQAPRTKQPEARPANPQDVSRINPSRRPSIPANNKDAATPYSGSAPVAPPAPATSMNSGQTTTPTSTTATNTATSPK